MLYSTLQIKLTVQQFFHYEYGVGLSIVHYTRGVQCVCIIYEFELDAKCVQCPKDSLKSTYFATVDDVLLRVYYLYKNSVKKCRELEEVVQSLRHCFMGSESGTVSATQFVSAGY